MKLIINRFPPITQRCEIDLSKKLTLFVGQNNSGKTYISQLIWGINKYAIMYSTAKPFMFISDKKMNKFSIDLCKNNFLKKLSAKFTEHIIDYTVKEIFKKNIDSNFEISIEERDIKSVLIEYLDDDIQIFKEKDSTEIIINIIKPIKDIERVNLDLEFLIVFRLFQNSLFLPSSRLFLPSFYKYIFNTEKDFKDSIFQNLDKIDKTNKKFYAPSYTQAVDDLIKKLIFSLDRPLKHSEYLDILANIMEGNISIDKAEEIGMADISYNHKSGENIPMYLSSSMVNQLSTLYLYFKYWYEKEDNSFLIMDEPEMNLHPSKKIEVLELLMHFSSKNKLLIATHSNTIAKTIINYLHLFDLKEKEIDIEKFIKENELKMKSNIELTSNDVGIYYFNRKTIIPYKRDNESNIHFGTFSEVEELQNKQFEDIMNELDNYDT